MTITETNRISELLDLVHDRWFDIAELNWDRDRAFVALRLARRKKDLGRTTNDQVTLVIRNAESLKITDTEKVQIYDLNEITYDDHNQLVTITGGIPITIQVKVTSLHLEVT